MSNIKNDSALKLVDLHANLRELNNSQDTETREIPKLNATSDFSTLSPNDIRKTINLELRSKKLEITSKIEQLEKNVTTLETMLILLSDLDF